MRLAVTLSLWSVAYEVKPTLTHPVGPHLEPMGPHLSPMGPH